MCNIVLITDDPFFREGFIGFASRQGRSDLVVVGHVETLGAASSLRNELHVDVVIVDVALVDAELGALARLAGEFAGTAGVLVVGSRQDEDRLGQIMATGVRSYIRKTSDGRAILSAISAVIEEGLVPSSLARHPFVRGHPLDHLPRGAHHVSAREMMVLKRTAFGYSAKEIARDLAISQKSVETYKARATAKLGLVSRSDIIRYALRCGWFSSLLEDDRCGFAGQRSPSDEGSLLRS